MTDEGLHIFDEWILLMEEGQQAAKPKRQRVKKTDNALKGRGVMPAGKWIVCTYCGNTSEKALVPDSVVKGVAFCTLPCGIAWIHNNALPDQTKPCLLYTSDAADE